MTEARLAFRLPIPPSANIYWRVFRGHPVKSPEARVYFAECAPFLPTTPIAGGHVLSLTFEGLARAADLGNRLKVIEDVLNLSAYVDDKDAIAIHLMRTEGVPPYQRGVFVEVTGPRWATAAEIAEQRARNDLRKRALRKGRATRARNKAFRRRLKPAVRR